MAKKPTKPTAILYAVEAEQGILGACLNHPSLITDSERLTDSLFGIASNVVLFRAIAERVEESGTADFIGIATILRKAGTLDELHGEVNGKPEKGAAYISALTFLGTSVGHSLEEAVKTCEDAAARRRVISECENGIKAIHAGEDPDEVVGRVETHLGLVTERKTREDKTPSLLNQLEARIDQRQDGKIKLGMPTGVPSWDKALAGIFPGEMTIIGARPGVGKTSMIETAMQMQIECGKHVACFQQDMAAVVMLERIACRMANVVYETYSIGKATSGDYHAIRDRLRVLRKMSKRFHIYNEAKLTANVLCSIVRRLKRQVELAVWYLDHFQTLRYEEENRTEGLTNASMTVRDLITTTEIPGMIVAQLNKEAHDSRPNAGQFKYCDQLFSDADRVILLWSNDDPKELRPNQRQEVIFTVDKNRGGGVGDERMHFHRELMTFEVI